MKLFKQNKKFLFKQKLLQLWESLLKRFCFILLCMKNMLIFNIKYRKSNYYLNSFFAVTACKYLRYLKYTAVLRKKNFITENS